MRVLTLLLLGVLALIAPGCVTGGGGGGSGGGGGGGGGTGGNPEADAGGEEECAPRPGLYDVTFALADDAHEDCPSIEPDTERFGDDDEDECEPGCTCVLAVSEQDGQCVAVVGQVCPDDDLEADITLNCLAAVEPGAESFAGACEVEFADQQTGDVFFECAYGIAFTRRGD